MGARPDPLLAPKGRQSGVPFPGKPRHFHVAGTGNAYRPLFFVLGNAYSGFECEKYPDALGCVDCRVEKGVL